MMLSENIFCFFSLMFFVFSIYIFFKKQTRNQICFLYFSVCLQFLKNVLYS